MRDAKSRFAVTTDRADTAGPQHGGALAVPCLSFAPTGVVRPRPASAPVALPLAACLSLLVLAAAALAGTADAAYNHEEGPTFEMRTRVTSSQPNGSRSTKRPATST